MSTIDKCMHNDWCHVCGRREDLLTNVWYPNNAEHDSEPTQRIRICAGCAEQIAGVARGILPNPLETKSPAHNRHKSAFRNAHGLL